MLLRGCAVTGECGHDGLQVIGKLRVEVVGELHEVRECFEVFGQGAPGIELCNGGSELVNGVYFLHGNGLILAGKNAILQPGEDKITVAGKNCGHCSGCLADSIPVVLLHPVMDGAATNTNGFCNFCFG